MLYCRLDLPDTYASFLTHPVWVEALNWLRAMPPDIAPGIHPLRGEQMFVNVHGYETRPREACRYESHQRYIDLQYCITGGELIEWTPLHTLVAKDKYDSKKDVSHYHVPARTGCTVAMNAGTFAVFYPAEAHMPKISDGTNSTIIKLVLKVDRIILDTECA